MFSLIKMFLLFSIRQQRRQCDNYSINVSKQQQQYRHHHIQLQRTGAESCFETVNMRYGDTSRSTRKQQQQNMTCIRIHPSIIASEGDRQYRFL